MARRKSRAAPSTAPAARTAAASMLRAAAKSSSRSAASALRAAAACPPRTCRRRCRRAGADRPLRSRVAGSAAPSLAIWRSPARPAMLRPFPDWPARPSNRHSQFFRKSSLASKIYSILYDPLYPGERNGNRTPGKPSGRRRRARQCRGHPGTARLLRRAGKSRGRRAVDGRQQDRALAAQILVRPGALALRGSAQACAAFRRTGVPRKGRPARHLSEQSRTSRRMPPPSAGCIPGCR